MKKFLLLLHENVASMQQLSPKEMENLVQAHFTWAQKLGSLGKFVGGDGLQETGAQILGKESTIKDGPYMESKEMIGGYYIILAEDLAEAVELAKNCPCHLWGGTTEVRPIMEYEEHN